MIKEKATKEELLQRVNSLEALVESQQIANDKLSDRLMKFEPLISNFERLEIIKEIPKEDLLQLAATWKEQHEKTSE